jgi:drug/metabolite transporter (DMT)-like permease
MVKADIAGLLALGAALFIAIGDVVHQRSAHEVTDEPVGNIGLFVKLLRDRRWWLGSLVSAGGFALQAAALGIGSVLLVQALLVSSLLFALLISARLSRRAVTGGEWVSAVLLGAAVAVIVTVGNPQAGQSRASLQIWTAVAAVLGPALVACVVGARILGGRIAAVLLALASGSLWGLFAVLTKGVVGQLGNGVGQLVRTPELYAWVLVAVTATAWQQSAFRAGALTASLPTMTVTEPVVGAALGVVVLGETMHSGDAGLMVLVAAVLVMVLATVALAHSEAVATQPRVVDPALDPVGQPA